MSCTYKNLKAPAVECLLGEWKLPRVQETFYAKQHLLKWIPAPENCKNQEINGIKSKKINRTLATNNLILS